jgi:hypothetical protein
VVEGLLRLGSKEVSDWWLVVAGMEENGTLG